MKQYRIANEIVAFKAKRKKNELSFNTFLTIAESSDVILQIEDDYNKEFQDQHRNLSSAQCELILLMRSFYDYLVSKDKLFMHATVVVYNDLAYIIIAKSSGGKSTLAKQMVEAEPESTFIFADDRIVLGKFEETLVVWATPWSKIINGNVAQYYVVKGFCIIQKSDTCSICSVDEEEIIEEILNEYPAECRIDVGRILHTINLKNCNLLRVRSNIHDLCIEKIYEMMK